MVSFGGEEDAVGRDTCSAPVLRDAFFKLRTGLEEGSDLIPSSVSTALLWRRRSRSFCLSSLFSLSSSLSCLDRIFEEVDKTEEEEEPSTGGDP